MEIDAESRIQNFIRNQLSVGTGDNEIRSGIQHRLIVCADFRRLKDGDVMSGSQGFDGSGVSTRLRPVMRSGCVTARTRLASASSSACSTSAAICGCP